MRNISLWLNLFVLPLFSADLFGQVPVTLWFNKKSYPLTSEVYALGSFNGWKSKDPNAKLIGPDSSGYFRGSILMSQGEHSYVFSIGSGPVLPDSKNPRLTGRALEGFSHLLVSDPMVTYLFPMDGDTAAFPQGSAIEAQFDFSQGNPITLGSLQVKIDGINIPNASQYYNPTTRIFRYVPTDWIQPGQHSVEISVSSSVGTTTRKSTFRRGPAAQILNPVTIYPMTSIVLFGRTNDASISQITVTLNGMQQVVNVQNREFKVPLTLVEGKNAVSVAATDQFGNQSVDSREFIVQTILGPSITIESSVNGRDINLTAVLPNGHPSGVTYNWTQSLENTPPLTLSGTSGNSITAKVPLAAWGEYFIEVTGTDGEGRTSSAARIIVAAESSIRVADIDERSNWIDRMVIYLIQPRSFSSAGTLKAITAGLSELSDLGVNTIYMQPLFDSNEGTGYWIFDYFKLRSIFGTIDDFKELVSEARKRGIRLFLDYSVNHSSIDHPFFRDVLALKGESPFANFYRWNGPPADTNYLYFFPTAPQWNHDNPEVRKYLMHVAEYWMREIKLDGLRGDGALQIMNRTPQFWTEVRTHIKNIRPDAFLLAEAFPYPASSSYFDKRFDAVEDMDLRGYGYEDRNILPKLFSGTATLNDLDQVIRAQPANGYSMRFSDDHNHDRLSRVAGVAQSKLVNTLILTARGIPMIWSGTEYGYTGGAFNYNPYPRVDNGGFRERVKKLIAVRKRYLKNSAQMGRLSNSTSNSVYSYYTKSGDNLVVGVLNFSGGTVSTLVNFSGLPIAAAGSYRFLDVLTDADVNIAQTQLQQVAFTLPAWGAAIYHINAQTGVPTSVEESSDQSGSVPHRFVLEQNFPNPFNPSTTIRFSVQKTGRAVLRAFDLLGRELRTLFDAEAEAGRMHQVVFDGAGLTSGLYFIRLESDEKAATQKLVLVK